MRKLFAFLILAGLLIMVFPNKVILIAKSFLLEEPTTHLVERNDWLSKMALKYYDDASYWKELALVNRAPDPNLILPGEQIFIPAFEAIQQLRNASTISSVQNVIAQQELALRQSGGEKEERVADTTDESEPGATQPSTQTAEAESGEATNGSTNGATETVPSSGVLETVPPQTESAAEGFPWIWIVAAALIIAGLGGLLLYGRKRTQDADNEVEADRKEKSGEVKLADDSDIFNLPPARNNLPRKQENGSKKPKKDADLIHG